MNLNFQAGIYYDPETGRRRWAVLSSTSKTWYFAKRYGESPARTLAKRLNASDQH